MEPKRISSLLIPLLLLLLFSAPVSSNDMDIFEITIDVSPNVLNIQSNGTVVTIHTDIKYYEVDFTSVYLNDILIQSWKSDDRGYFVAKFSMDEVKDLPLSFGNYNILTLIGQTRAGDTFSGSQDILVINNIPSKK